MAAIAITIFYELVLRKMGRLHRVELMSRPDSLLACDNCTFVIASQKLDLLGEINWPGTVQIGTRVVKVGHSSTTLHQGLYQLEKCVAVAETVIVQMHEITRKSHPLSEPAKVVLNKYVDKVKV